MSDQPAKKSWYDVLAALTPLIIGIGVTGVGAFYTQQNFSQNVTRFKVRPGSIEVWFPATAG